LFILKDIYLSQSATLHNIYSGRAEQFLTKPRFEVFLCPDLTLFSNNIGGNLAFFPEFINSIVQELMDRIAGRTQV
jgi:hypothetical protein